MQLESPVISIFIFLLMIMEFFGSANEIGHVFAVVGFLELDISWLELLLLADFAGNIFAFGLFLSPM